MAFRRSWKLGQRSCVLLTREVVTLTIEFNGMDVGTCEYTDQGVAHLPSAIVVGRSTRTKNEYDIQQSMHEKR